MFLTVIGLVLVVEGIPYFTMPDKAKEVAQMILTADSKVLRVIGLVLMLSGLLMVAIGKTL